MFLKPEIIFESPLSVGESPVWDEKMHQLYFVDIRDRCFYCMDYQTGQYEKYCVPQWVGCLALCQNGDLLLSMEDGIYIQKPNGQRRLAHQPIQIKGERFNDGKVGPDGCYYVGTAGENFSGAFYRLRDGVITELFDQCGCSNGIAWNRGGDVLYYCDSRKQKLEKFTFHINTHTVSERQSIFKIPLNLGCGDGMSIDADGNIWLAIWGGACVQHIEATTGKILDIVELPVAQVSSCCFAGDDLGDLIITTAAVRTDTNEQPHAGKIFRIQPGVRGIVFNRYQS